MPTTLECTAWVLTWLLIGAVYLLQVEIDTVATELPDVSSQGQRRIHILVQAEVLKPCLRFQFDNTIVWSRYRSDGAVCPAVAARYRQRLTAVRLRRKVSAMCPPVGLSIGSGLP